MCVQVAVGEPMFEPNHIIVSHDSTSARFWNRLGGLDQPVVVAVIVPVAGDLLAMRAHSAIFVLEWIWMQVGM
jgi:hypothetical protein